jgi:hypothetical protein
MVQIYMENPAAKARDVRRCTNTYLFDRSLLLILAIALFISLAWFFLVIDKPGKHGGDKQVYEQLALNLSNGNGLTRDGHTPSAFVVPVYPVFLAAIYTIFGHNNSIVYLIQIAIYLMTVVLVVRLGIILTRSRRASLVAAAIAATYLPLIQHTSEIMTEILFTFLLVAAVLMTVIAWNKQTNIGC